MTITLDRLTKTQPLRDGQRINVFKDLSLTIPAGRSIALLGRNGAGKSTLLQLIAGTNKPDRGRVIKTGTVSWPIGFGNAFHLDLTGAQNVRFIARLYGVDTDALVSFVAEFAELGVHFHSPVRRYSSGMKARLTFGSSMGIAFDTYLVDEVTSVGDAAFRAKSRAYFAARMHNAGAVLVSHDMQQVRTFCEAGLLLQDGQLTFHEDLEEAIFWHKRAQGLR